MPRRKRKQEQDQPIPIVWSFVLRYNSLSIYDSAFRHGILPDDIRHAHNYALVFASIDTFRYQARLLILGPDRAGNMLELIGIPIDESDLIVIHAMRVRSQFAQLLP